MAVLRAFEGSLPFWSAFTNAMELGGGTGCKRERATRRFERAARRPARHGRSRGRTCGNFSLAEVTLTSRA